jgi:hypothetical protein
MRTWARAGMALALAAGLGPGAAAADGARKDKAMAETKSTVAKISGIDTSNAGADGTLTLEDGSRLTLPHQSPLFEFWSGWLPEQQTAKKPVYVEYDPGSKAAQRILATTEWGIEQVAATAEGDRLRVILLMKPSAYWLRTSRAEYAAWRALLEEAQKTEEPLLLVTQPETYEILHVAKLK